MPDPTVRAICAGASAGLVEAFANCPFEVVKVRMQAKSSVRANPTTIRLLNQLLQVYKNTVDATVQIAKGEGVLALYKGIVPQLYRNGVWNGNAKHSIAHCR